MAFILFTFAIMLIIVRSYFSFQMELTRSFLESWVSDNTERTSDREYITTGNELWAEFQNYPAPSLQPQRSEFLSMLGQVLKSLGYDRVGLYRNKIHKVGYRGSMLKCRVESVDNKAVENVKNWANSSLSPGSLSDSISKEAAWTLFIKFGKLDTTEHHCQQFFRYLETTLLDKVLLSFVGITFKEANQRESEPPIMCRHTIKSEGETKHSETNKGTVSAEDSNDTIQEEAFTMPHNVPDVWVTSDIDLTDGNSSDCMNERELSHAAHIKLLV